MAAGTFVTGALTADDPVISELKAGTKYYECTVAGELSFFSSTTDRWDISVYRPSSPGGIMALGFMALDNLTYIPSYSGTAYVLRPNGASGLDFFKYVSGSYATELFDTAASYQPEGSWYSYRIQRQTSGVINILTKGGSFGDEYVKIVIVSGSNPILDTSITRSVYINCLFWVGDRFMWTPDERLTGIGGTQYGVNPLIEEVPKAAGAVSLTV